MRSRSLKSTVLVVGAIAGALTFAAPKALANDYNPSNQQEPVQAGRVMKDDTTYEYFELIGDTNSGFEFPENEMDWEGKVISGDISRVRLHWPGNESHQPFKDEFLAQVVGGDYGYVLGAAQIEINLSSEDTLRLGELDSLLFAMLGGVFRLEDFDYWNLRVDITSEGGDTLTYAYGQDMENSEHRKVRNVEGTFFTWKWYEQKFEEDLREFVRENGSENEKIKSLRFYIESIPGTAETNLLDLDEVYLHATRQIISSVQEETPTQRPTELSDIILGSSNLYQATFPERGTLTIYEASTGRRVQAPIEVYGHVDVDFSGFPAGVYFGVYKPQEGRHQVGKIIKTQ